ncbi:hypothetical protein CHUAL_004336 [Chamberlinius hualienensis]
MKKETSEVAWISNEIEENVACEFEDNFKPFCKMNDSSTYVAALENKLSKLKCGRKILTGKEMVDTLFMAKADHMRHHLNEGHTIDITANEFENHSENIADTKIQTMLIGKLYPERQALTSEELVHLLAADKLSITKEESEIAESH